MRKNFKIRENKAQTAIEYMLLLAAVVAIVLVGLKTYIPNFRGTANIYFNRVGEGILGVPPRCGDGICRPCPYESCTKCPADCGSCGGIPSNC